MTATSMSPPVAHESAIAAQLARHALYVAPAILIAAGIYGGAGAVISAGIGLVIVAMNFLASARLIAWAALKSPSAVQAAVLGGFLARLVVLTALVFALAQVNFIDAVVLVLTIAVTHLGLLIWETRYVSLTLGAPGLKPGVIGRSEEE
ncbi:MAG: hypothetical protein EXQ69_03540 [Acidimicrobiia bacterium]|nr:hypothetical protein [Acidimicrobiia bacterium]